VGGEGRELTIRREREREREMQRRCREGAERGRVPLEKGEMNKHVDSNKFQ